MKIQQLLCVAAEFKLSSSNITQTLLFKTISRFLNYIEVYYEMFITYLSV